MNKEILLKLNVFAPLVIASFPVAMLAMHPPIYLMDVLYGMMIGLCIGWVALRYDQQDRQ